MSVDTTRYIVPRSQLPPVPQFGCSASCDANTNTFSQPPLDGSLCTSEIYEWHAQHSPNHPLFQYRVEADDESVTTISYKDAVKAIYRGGWFLRGALEGTGRKVEGRGKRPIIAVIALSGAPALAFKFPSLKKPHPRRIHFVRSHLACS